MNLLASPKCAPARPWSRRRTARDRHVHATLNPVLGQCARVRFAASLLKAVAEVDDAAAESVLVDELEIGAKVVWQCGVATTEDDWPHEQGELVDQPGDESLCCKVRATDQQI